MAAYLGWHQVDGSRPGAQRDRAKRARKETWQRVEPMQTGFLRVELDGMPVPGPLLGLTRLAWLGTGPVSSTPGAVKGELEKLAYLRGMDALTRGAAGMRQKRAAHVR